MAVNPGALKVFVKVSGFAFVVVIKQDVGKQRLAKASGAQKNRYVRRIRALKNFQVMCLIGKGKPARHNG